jgi:hypothetical protein
LLSVFEQATINKVCGDPGGSKRVAANVRRQAGVAGPALHHRQDDAYQTTSPDLSVRIDVTYLRPDLSVMQAVADANPWPEMQRFDFLVRTRTLTADEATAAREKLATRDPGSPSPYQRATLAALRELTGRDTGPTADAWRRMLSLPAPERQEVLAPQ